MHNCEVAADNQPGNKGAGLGEKITKMGMELRRPSGDIQGFHGVVTEKPKDILYYPTGHFLDPVWSGINMAMQAALIANTPQVNLKRSDSFFFEKGKL
jgi:hypothetical protein